MLSSTATSEDVQLLPSTPPLIPQALSLTIPMDMMDMMDMMDIVDAMDAVDPKQDTTYAELFPGASESFGKGETFIDLFNGDEYAENQKTNLYYPFTSQQEWELASFLLKSGLSMVVMDEFLKLQIVSTAVPL